MPLFGAHMSIAGGLHLAVERISRVGGTALQVFTKNQRQWRTPPLGQDEIASFRAARQQWGGGPVAAHGSYLINLTSPDPVAVTRSVAAMAEEIRRAALLRILFLIIHPGAHMGAGIEAGLARFTANLDLAMDQATGPFTVTVLLETTAGQGTSLGSHFDELGWIIAHSRFAADLGVCFDTCHVFGAGYDLRTAKAYGQTMTAFDRIIGLDRLRFFHLNDSKRELGSRIDRHAHIGEGAIGKKGFSQLVNDPRFQQHPMILETPKSKNLAEDITNLTVLRSLCR